MQHPNGSGQAPGGQDRYALRVVRLQPGEVCLFRMLSERYTGLLTHWIAGRGQYCAGVHECPRSLHQRPAIWKGYMAAEVWCPVKRLWFPCVPELTEYVELDLRGRYARGQTWEFRKAKKQGDKNSPVVATLTETNDPATMPRSFDVRAVVATVYHVPEVQFGVDNPMPPKVLVEPSAGPAPAGKEGGEERPANSSEHARKLLDMWRKRQQLNGGAE